jgi:hypothetical protein
MNNLSQLFSGTPFDNKYLAFIIIIWSLIIKGLGLWKSARNKQRNWFIVLLVVNTVGILELIYIKFFQKNLNNYDIKITKNKK